MVEGTEDPDCNTGQGSKPGHEEEPGAYRTTQIAAMEAELAIPTVKVGLGKFQRKYVLRCVTLLDNHAIRKKCRHHFHVHWTMTNNTTPCYQKGTKYYHRLHRTLRCQQIDTTPGQHRRNRTSKHHPMPTKSNESISTSITKARKTVMTKTIKNITTTT